MKSINKSFQDIKDEGKIFKNEKKDTDSNEKSLNFSQRKGNLS